MVGPGSTRGIAGSTTTMTTTTGRRGEFHPCLAGNWHACVDQQRCVDTVPLVYDVAVKKDEDRVLEKEMDKHVDKLASRRLF